MISDKMIIIPSGHYEGVEGTVDDENINGYRMVTTICGNYCFVKESEIDIIDSHIEMYKCLDCENKL